MTNVRLPRGLCKVVGEALQGSHQSLDALFISAGAPGDPPALAHHSKWKEWLFRAGQDTKVDSLAVLGNILEEFMDAPPANEELRGTWEISRQNIVNALEESGLRYFPGGRIIPSDTNSMSEVRIEHLGQQPTKPTSLEELLGVLVNGLPRAIYPLQHRRKGMVSLSFQSEYDIQDLLHALLRPWIADIRPEECTPSYAGSSTRMDFLLPKYNLVIETKLIRDKAHGTKIGDELIIDIEHYRAHPSCNLLWCIIYDPNHFIPNKGGLVRDLSGQSKTDKGILKTTVMVI